MTRTAFARLLSALLALVGLLLAFEGRAEPSADDADKTLSPYFFVDGAKPGSDSFPLVGTEVDVRIAGVIADVEVVQVYDNDGTTPINARYVFPASSRAAVHAMQMTVGDRVIQAVIREREQARQEFEQAKQEGKTASLLEQQRPNVFSMDVSNVMPGDRIEVRLSYTELLVPTNGVYEFVYPTVVGPRYVSEGEQAKATSDDNWVAQPTLPAGNKPPSTFRISGKLVTGVPIGHFDVKTHPTTSSRANPNELSFSLDPSETHGGNRDFIAQYRLQGDAIQTGLSLYEKDGKKFFLAMVQPPKRVETDQIPAREYVFVVDVSGSMYGFPIDTAKALMHSLTARLRPIDRFNVMFFSGGSQLMSPHSVPATKENVERATLMLDQIQGGGGTELLPALQRALSLSPAEKMSRNFVVITDGYIMAEKAAFEHIQNNLGTANVYAFGIGSSVNRYLIEGIAKAGLGEAFIVTDANEAPAVAARFREYIKAPVLTDVKVAFDGFDAYDVEPKALPDVLAERPVLVYGKYRGAPKGKLTIKGFSGRGAFEQSLEVNKSLPSENNRALPLLWARTRIGILSDFNPGEPSEDERQAIVKLGLEYNLLTRYTSFIAVSQLIRNPDGNAKDVTQPQPLPQGVSNYAVGEVMGAAEPELWLMLALLLLSCGFHLARKRYAERLTNSEASA